jgi:CBS domain-containing protein
MIPAADSEYRQDTIGVVRVSKPTDEFIRCFEKIKTEVNRRAGEPSSLSFEIERAADRDGFVRKNRPVLIYMRDVRNALQHPKHRSVGPAVEVTEAFLSEVQDLLRYLENPPNASSVGVARKQIVAAKLSDRLGDLAGVMKRGGFSHIPILNEEEAVIGVFNEAAVFDHLWADAETIIGRQMMVADIFRHCHLEAGHTETFKFVSPRTPLESLVAMFLALESATTRIGAAFVTASGKSNEPLQRLITPWDVLASATA